MPKIRITQLPKYVNGGTPPNCDPGYMQDPSDPTKCIPVGIGVWAPGQGIYSTTSTTTRPSIPYEGAANDINESTTNPFSTNFSALDWAGKLLERPEGGYSSDKVKKEKKGFFGDMTPAEKRTWLGNTAELALAAGNVWATDKQSRQRKKAYEKQFRFAQFNPAAQPGDDKGYWTQDSQRTFQPNRQAPVNEGMMNRQAGGTIPGQTNGKVKIKIIDGPEPFSMKYGGQFEGSYGLDVGWRNLYTDMAKTSSDHITNSMSEKKNPKEDYVLEAEGGEVLWKPGDHTSHDINGNPHYLNGVKLTDSQVSSKTAPDISSFIFSQTKSMAIKDPEILAQFGIKSSKKGGVVPAKIAKMFPLNKYKAIIDDPNKDDLAKRTAALGLDQNEKYLALLSAVQEGMKGKEAPEFVQTILGGEKAEAKDGGWVFKMNKLRKFVTGGEDTDPKKDEIDPLTKEGKTRTGKSNKYVKGPEYLKKWESVIPEITKMSNKEAQSAIYDYMLENHPDKVREMWKEYGLTNKGFGIKKLRYMTTFNRNNKNQRVYTGVFEDASKLTDEQLKDLKEAYVDGQFGARQIDIPDETPTTTTTTAVPPSISIPGKEEEEEEDVTEDKFICVVDKEKGYAIKRSRVGYDSEEEARANCGTTAKLPPFDYPLPDKVAMAAAALVFPKKDYPTIANRPYERGRYALNDWAAAADRAFNTQFLAPSRALATYTSPQGLMSNMSAASGQAADTIVGNIIPTVTSQNVGTFNQFSANEQQRKDAIDDYNAKAQVARDEGRGLTEQTFQQELADYAQNNAQQFAKAWIDRYKYYDAAFGNPNFYRDPRTGRPVFRNTGGFMGASGEDDGTDVGSMGSSFNAYYKKFYDDMSNISDPVKRDLEARRMAGKAVGAGRVSSSYKDPYDFYGKRKRTTSYDLPEDDEEETTE